MSEYMRGYSDLLTLECTVASNTLGMSTTGFGDTGTAGQRFVGITDEAYSAGDGPITVWRKGVFKMYVGAGSATDVANTICTPVFADSGRTVLVGMANHTGDHALGCLVRLNENSCASACWIGVKINPGAFRTMFYNVAADATATSVPAMGFPKRKR
jgi:hypothetical protein